MGVTTTTMIACHASHNGEHETKTTFVKSYQTPRTSFLVSHLCALASVPHTAPSSMTPHSARQASLSPKFLNWARTVQQWTLIGDSSGSVERWRRAPAVIRTAAHLILKWRSSFYSYPPFAATYCLSRYLTVP